MEGPFWVRQGVWEQRSYSLMRLGFPWETISLTFSVNMKGSLSNGVNLHRHEISSLQSPSTGLHFHYHEMGQLLLLCVCDSWIDADVRGPRSCGGTGERI